MDIENLLGFLVKDFGLSYKYQIFNNCYGGNWIVQTYSFYNATGCFTIQFLPQKQELDFYYASSFSVDLKDLCERLVDICLIEPDIWNKHSRFLGVNCPFFWCNNNKVLTTFSQALKMHLSHNDDFFGITVKIEDSTKS